MNCIKPPTLFVGPMSKNVVDACIEYTNETGNSLGLIPSRRQVDNSSGYVNGWRTDTLAQYVRSKTNLIVLQRDHGGPAQGDQMDDGMDSMYVDSKHFDLIHIDPFKKHKTLHSAMDYTVAAINAISKVSECEFEIGTEEAIFPMSVQSSHEFFDSVRKGTGKNFDRVRYLVVQFGTKIIGTHNTGKFDPDRANSMIELCESFGKLSKEHNGDYLSPEGVHSRRVLGLEALNIAPEMGGIETECILEEISGNSELIESFFNCCIATNRWQKWFPHNFNPEENMIDVLRACGHYCFSMPQFKSLCDRMNYAKITENSKQKIKERIGELV